MTINSDQIKPTIKQVKLNPQSKERAKDAIYSQLLTEIKYRDEEIKNLKSDRGLRTVFSISAFCYTWVWTSAMFVILFFQGFDFKDFELDTKLLMVLVGSSMFNVISLSITTVRGIFGRK